MTQQNSSDSYELFYMEIPQTETDPLNDISTDIQDEHETPDYDQIQGLSNEQVSEIARDSLHESPEPAADEPGANDQDT